jgi:hypothetical protein
VALVLENGFGVRNANAYIAIAYVTAYLTARNRVTEGLWSTSSSAEQEAAIIAATDYIDTRWGPKFKGTKRTRYQGQHAQALVSFSGVPTADDTFVLGGQTYTWKAALTTLGNDEILIGATDAICATSLIDAINGNADGVGVTSSSFLVLNDQASAALEDGETTSILITAHSSGVSGNDTPLSEVMDNFAIDVAFVNGLDSATQQREFPRGVLFDSNGIRVIGIPEKLKEACAEYAVRANVALLYTDPSVDATGRVVTEKMEKVGPIETRTKYEAGSALTQLIAPYPAADQLLKEYIMPGGKAFR